MTSQGAENASENGESRQKVKVIDRLQGVLLPTADQVAQALIFLANAPLDTKRNLNYNAFQSVGNSRQGNELGVNTNLLEYYLNDVQIANALYGIALGMKGYNEASIQLGYSPAHVFSSMKVDITHNDYGYYLSVHDQQWRNGKENPDEFVARLLGIKPCLVAKEFHVPQSTDGVNMVVDPNDILEKIGFSLTDNQRVALQTQFHQNFVPMNEFANMNRFVADVPLTPYLHLVVRLPHAKSQDAWRDRGNGTCTIPFDANYSPEIILTLEHERNLRDYTDRQYPIIDSASILEINRISPFLLKAFSENSIR